MAESWREFVEFELQCLWGDLVEARREAVNGVWSIRCDGLGERIKDATALVGPVDWGAIQIPFILSGLYEDSARRIGVEFTAPSVSELEDLRALWARHRS